MRSGFGFILFASALIRVAAAPLPHVQEVPFQYREGFLWIKVSLARSNEPLNFLVDTGAGVSVINAATANRLGLKTGRSIQARGVNTTLRGTWVEPVSAAAGEVTLPCAYIALDLGKLSLSCEQPIDGLLGADFFRGRVVKIDFVAQKLRISNASRTGQSGDSIALQFRPCGIRVPISVNGRKPQWLRLDTGCASALQWVASGVEFAQCIRKPAIGLAEVSISQTQTTVAIGQQKFTSVPTGIHEKPIFQGEAGLLGNGLLSRFFSITIDAKSRRLILETR